MPLEENHETRQWVLSGKVQGVGFRPYIYTLAHHYKLNGWVRNNLGQVEIKAQGKKSDLDDFDADLIGKAPTISEPKINQSKLISGSGVEEVFDEFKILESESLSKADIHVPADFFTCPECLAEMDDPSNRRYQYPFTNCTQCGPRYTLIESLPYDRKNTSMEEFPLCDDCRKEYKNPLDRRFHAEPIACPVCGPQLSYKNGTSIILNTEDALQACVQSLSKGKIVAVKGIGGYHLMCDASNDEVIQKLRESKGRPSKPLAVMFPAFSDDDLGGVRDYLDFTPSEGEILSSPSRPIVLLKKKKADKGLSKFIAPNLNEIGAMLAYSPLHHLLLNNFGKPLVATSANISGEPVLVNDQEVEQRLNHITHNFLHHNRRIVRPADDSVYRTIGYQPRPLRLGRGNAPIEIELPFKLDKAMIAYGSHMKNTVALAWDNRLVVSPHIGDLDSPRSLDVFQSTIEDLQKLYQVNATSVACDFHPAYASTRWAKQSNLPVHPIQHHKAHASALVIEYWNQTLEKPWLVFTWDGTGYGEDDSIWGSEAFYGSPGHWKRVASFRPFYLPGGEKAGREPWRSAAALCWEEDKDWDEISVDSSLLKEAWKLKINAPKSTAMGRIFDAASALTGIIQTASFEGEGPMLLEQKCQSLFSCESLSISKKPDAIWEADWASLIPEMQNNNQSVEDRATLFHSVMAHTLLKQVELLNEENSVTKIGLSGGVFQNRKLTDYVMKQLDKKGYTVFVAKQLPVNDAGISAGQIVEAAMQNKSQG